MISEVEAYKAKGNLAFQAGKFEQAVAEYTKGIEFLKSNKRPTSIMNTMYNFISLQENIEKSIPPPSVKNQLLAVLYSNRSAANLSKKSLIEASLDAQQAINLNPSEVKYIYRLAEVKFQQNLYHESLKLFIQCSELMPKDHISYSNIIEKITLINFTLKDMDSGLKILQISPGKDICFKTLLAPIQSAIFDYAIQMKNFIYFISHRASKQALIVDACWDIDGILKFATENDVEIVGAILTHYHVDHAGGIPPPPFDKYGIRVDGLAKLLKKLPHIKVFINEHEIPQVIAGNPDISQKQIVPTTDGFEVSLPLEIKPKNHRHSFSPMIRQNTATRRNTLNSPLNFQQRIPIKFIHTPGHSRGSQCILVNNNRLFTGDTMFIGSCGRVVLPGHAYGGKFTTIQWERESGILSIEAFGVQLIIRGPNSYKI
ncbi:hypothetical protein HK099_004241 [Clydaea vesicula]|uniref:Metallo-beta-lactamase domain-containing protein n=1 Tax=Clydaea vesicula TaxID=447962 RepID=A0AAD5U0H0_9FUNG|nr:hypothetical protein HK099_004241 [Clydaea vesicula]